jgi:hypothetical protein
MACYRAFYGSMLAVDDIEDDVNSWVDDSREAISKGFLEYFTMLEDPG